MRFKELSSPKKTQNLKVPHSWLLIFLLSSSSVRSAKESSVIWQWYWYTNWLVLSVKLLHLSIHNLSCKQFGCYNVLHLLTKKSQTLYQNKRSGLIGVLRTLKFMSRRSHFIQERRVLSLMPLTKIQFVFSCQHWQKWSTSLSLMYVLFFLFVTLCNFYLFSCSFFEFFFLIFSLVVFRFFPIDQKWDKKWKYWKVNIVDRTEFSSLHTTTRVLFGSIHQKN